MHMAEPKGSVKLFGATIEVATLRETSPIENLVMEKPKVKIKEKEQGGTDSNSKESGDPAASSVESEYKEAAAVFQETEDEQNEKIDLCRPQKPTKILPCPRCRSLDTKFCYFNNYKANQHRHFCRACQRYWTDGGAMRNMAVGAGRRKSKNASSRTSLANPAVQKSNHLEKISERNILQFSGESHHRNHDSVQKKNRDLKGDTQNSTESSSLSCSSSTMDPSKQDTEPKYFQAPCFLASPWNQTHTLCSAYIPVSFYLEIPSLLSMPGGKHPSDGSIVGGKHAMEPNDSYCTSQDRDACLLKSARIDDPIEAAQSSVWTAVSSRESAAGGEMRFQGLFSTFHSKELENPKEDIIPRVLQANPSALLRSLEFNESVQSRKGLGNPSRKGC